MTCRRLRSSPGVEDLTAALAEFEAVAAALEAHAATRARAPEATTPEPLDAPR